MGRGLAPVIQWTLIEHQGNILRHGRQETWHIWVPCNGRIQINLGLVPLTHIASTYCNKILA